MMDPSTMHLVTGLLLGLLLKDHMMKSVEAQKFEFPKSLRALEGSCVVIPCKVTYAGPKPIIKGLQYKNWYQKEIYNSKNSSLVLESFLGRVSLVGDLAKGDCTVKIDKVNIADVGYYFPHIDSDPPTSEVEMRDSVYLSITGFPEPMTLSGPEEMTEGNNYSLTCGAIHTCPANPPLLRWTFRNLTAKTHHRELPNGEWETTSVITYNADSEDNWTFMTCSVEYPNHKKKERLLELVILYPPKMVSVRSTHETGHVKKGENVALTCQGYGIPGITKYTWYKNNQTSLTNYEFRTLDINRMTEDKSGQYYCVAGNKVGETKSKPITLLCIDCVSSRRSHMGGVVTVVVLLIVVILILAVVTLIWYRKKRASRPPRPATEEASTNTPIYMNIQVPNHPKPSPESPYAALQTHNRCQNYEQIQLQDNKATHKPTHQASPSYSEYEEVIPFRSLQNKKWKY